VSVDDVTFPDARRELTREVIVAALRTAPTRTQWRRTPAVIALAIAAVAASAGGAMAYYAFKAVESTETIRCFSDASLDGDAIYLGSTDGPDGRPVEFPDPIGACADLWSQGVLVWGVHNAQPPTPGASLPVPRLSACVIEAYGRDIVAVIPGDVTVCAELGLPRWAQ
jgi:hypothetical protein